MTSGADQHLKALSSAQSRPPLPPGPYLVVGLGRAGAAAARALAADIGAATIRAWDSASDPGQRERAQTLADLGLEVRLGGDGIEALLGVRTVVKSPGVPLDVPVIEEAHRRGIEILDEFEIGWRLVPAPTLAVTGTNGKSTVSSLCMGVLRAHGWSPVLAGNTEFGPPLAELSLGEAPRSVVAEVSSYQAEMSRRLAVDAAVLTNLTPDHLNRHKTMAAYGAAKRRLFVRDDWAVPLAVLNVDDEFGRRLAPEIEDRGGRAIRYGQDSRAAYEITSCQWSLTRSELTVASPTGPIQLTTRLPGLHNAANVTAVLALADGLGLPRETTLAALETAAPVPGRLEVVEVDRPFDVLVDLAIAVASVTAALATARRVASRRGSRLVTVLAMIGRAGTVAGRDVGATARALSDHLVLSGASYRGEPRIPTLEQLLAGARSVDGGSLEVVIDRREAIARAMEVARPGDLVAILGRGPIDREATDMRGGFHNLDDREMVRELA